MSFAHRRRMRHALEPYSKPNIISFADIVLVLLVIFLVSTSAAVEMVKINLPVARHTAGRDANLAVAISIAKDEQFYYEDLKTPVNAQALQTTAMGLVIAIPAFVAYNIFNHRANEHVRELRGQANRILVALGEM